MERVLSLYITHCFAYCGFTSCGLPGSYLLADTLEEANISHYIKCGIITILPQGLRFMHVWVEVEGVVHDVGLQVYRILFDSSVTCSYERVRGYTCTREDRRIERDFLTTCSEREKYWSQCPQQIMDVVDEVRDSIPLALEVVHQSSLTDSSSSVSI